MSIFSGAAIRSKSSGMALLFRDFLRIGAVTEAVVSSRADTASESVFFFRIFPRLFLGLKNFTGGDFSVSASAISRGLLCLGTQQNEAAGI